MKRGIDVNFSDVFISMKSYAIIYAVSEKPIFEIIKDDYVNTCKLWEFVDEYFNSKNGKKNFEEYSKKDIWKKIKNKK